MSRITRLSLIALPLLFAFAAAAPLADAASTTFTQSYDTGLWWQTYTANGTGPSPYLSEQLGYITASLTQIPVIAWFDLLRAPSVSVTYGVIPYDASTNAQIPDGSTVTVGTKIDFKPQLGTVSFAGQIADLQGGTTNWITINGTGSWLTNAAFPYGPATVQGGAAAYTPGYYDYYNTVPTFGGSVVASQGWITGTASVAIPFTINPPTETITNTGTANLSCTGEICTVNSTGTINAQVSFAATYGQFYGGYTNKASAELKPLVNNGYTTYSGQTCGWGGCTYTSVTNHGSVGACPQGDIPYSSGGTTYDQYYTDCGAQPPFQVSIPAHSFTYTMTAAPAPNPPTAPTVTPASSNTDLINSPQSFSLNATDPGSNTIRYGIDWNNDGTVDQWVPATGYVSSGTTETVSRTWTTTGPQTFQVLAENDQGARSSWTAGSITLGMTCTTGTWSATANACVSATLTANPTSIVQGQSTTLSWSSSGASSCNSTSIPDFPITGNTTSGNSLASPSTTTSYSVTCGVATANTTVTVLPPNLNIEAVPMRVQQGTAADVTWSASNVTGTACTITKNGSAWQTAPIVNNTVATTTVTDTINTQTTYAIVCGNGSNQKTVSTHINVVPGYSSY